MPVDSQLIIIGAGPFGLALAAHAQQLGIDYLVVGKPMEFWRDNMPTGMYLRSASDWHLDVANDATIERFLAEQGQTPAGVEPLSRDMYLRYVLWFQEQKQIHTLPVYVTQLDYRPNAARAFRAITDEGEVIAADKVVIAVGFKYFKHLPPDVVQLLPPVRFAHTCDLVDFTNLRDKRCLILGGRQSAFEWAALIHEAGAAAVHVAHRHPSPAFQAADWSWVNPLVDAMADNPGWFRNLAPEEKDRVAYHLWSEGRLKVEPWLERRIHQSGVFVWPQTRVEHCTELPDGTVAVTFDDDTTVLVDQIVLATGYKVQIDRVPFLAHGNILRQLATRNGFPVLDEHFQTNVPGLFITSMAAAQDFGPFWGFTIAVRTSARLIGEALTGQPVPPP